MFLQFAILWRVLFPFTVVSVVSMGFFHQTSSENEAGFRIEAAKEESLNIYETNGPILRENPGWARST